MISAWKTLREEGAMLKELYVRWTTAPEIVSDDPAEKRGYRVWTSSSVYSAATHASIAVLFAAVGAWPLFWFNVLFSVPAWLTANWFLRSKRVVAFAWISQAEIILHAAAATLVLGWNSAFHFYALIPFGLFGSGGTGRAQRWIQARGVVSVAAWGTLFVLFEVLEISAPWIRLSPTTLRLFYAFNVIGCVSLLGMIVTHLTREADAAERSLEKEHARSEHLLRNVLPAEIAARLKSGENVIADRVDDASVLFADIVGFTGLSERTSPARLVETLNQVFTRIDALAEHHNLEKIKTIGDAYMVAAGVPKARPDHAAAVARFALDLVRVLDDLEQHDGEKLSMRIGMNSGPLVAGVIGKRKFAYDLWGDTVNTAARMESHGVPGRVQVTAAAKERLGKAFRFEPRGRIDVKGKGEMETWFLVGEA